MTIPVQFAWRRRAWGAWAASRRYESGDEPHAPVQPVLGTTGDWRWVLRCALGETWDTTTAYVRYRSVGDVPDLRCRVLGDGRRKVSRAGRDPQFASLVDPNTHPFLAHDRFLALDTRGLIPQRNVLRLKVGIKVDVVDFVADPDLLDDIVATAAAIAADLQRLGLIAPN